MFSKTANFTPQSVIVVDGAFWRIPLHSRLTSLLGDPSVISTEAQLMFEKRRVCSEMSVMWHVAKPR
jgi:hypothetical protein